MNGLKDILLYIKISMDLYKGMEQSLKIIKPDHHNK